MCTTSEEDGGMLYLFNEGVPFRFSLLSFLFQTLASSPLRVSTPLLYNLFPSEKSFEYIVVRNF